MKRGREEKRRNWGDEYVLTFQRTFLSDDDGVIDSCLGSATKCEYDTQHIRMHTMCRNSVRTKERLYGRIVCGDEYSNKNIVYLYHLLSFPFLL